MLTTQSRLESIRKVIEQAEAKLCELGTDLDFAMERKRQIEKLKEWDAKRKAGADGG
jgi:hypothetical protein